MEDAPTRRSAPRCPSSHGKSATGEESSRREKRSDLVVMEDERDLNLGALPGDVPNVSLELIRKANLREKGNSDMLVERTRYRVKEPSRSCIVGGILLGNV